MAAEILGLDPSARILISTGNPDDPVIRKCKEYGVKGTLNKPYSIPVLSSTLREFFGQA
jgi:hypothetical protein